MTIFASIVLRNIPKDEVRIDLMQYSIRGNFRGFREAPATQPHYVSVRVGDGRAGFWCYPEAGEVVVKRYQPATGSFEDETPAATTRYAEMVAGGGLADFLLPYDQKMFPNWLKLTNHLRREMFPPVLHEGPKVRAPEGLEGEALRAWAEAHNRTRFGQAFGAWYGGEPGAFLAAFQYSFLGWLLAGDEGAFAQWGYLLQTAYHAGAENIGLSPRLFTGLVEAVLPQFGFLPEAAFAPGGMAAFDAGGLVNELAVAGLDAQAQALGAYLESRR